MMNRLHIDSLVSIGAVESGDNPESEIMFWKRRPDKSTPTASGRVSSAGSLPAAAWGPTVEKVRALRAAESFAASRKVMEEAQKSIDEIKSMTKGTHMNRKPEGRSSATILAEVDRLANSIQKSAGDVSKSAARAEVWRANPELKVEVRKAQAREREAGREAGKDVVATIDRAVKSHCMAISTDRENLKKTLSQIRNDVMHTAAGVEIKKLRAAALAGQVGSPTEIAKSADYADAWSILASWDNR